MCSAETSSSTTTSPTPRISFSLSFCQLVDENAIPPQQQTASSSSPSSDFEFGVIDCCRSSFNNEFSSADQLFQNGTILPVEMMMIMRNNEEETSCDQDNYKQPLPFLSPLYSSPPVNNKMEKTAAAAAEEEDHDVDKVQSKSTSSSFWGFKRNSSSTTTVNTNSKNNLSFLFPIPVLPRSSSSNKRWSDPKMVKSSSLSSAASRLLPQKTQVQLRKSRSSGAGGSYSIKVSPVLHFRAPNCICKSTKTTPSFLGCFFSARGNSNGNKKKI